jgi:hypothetical protein
MGSPPLKARYDILHSCTIELMSKKIISPQLALSGDFNRAKDCPSNSAEAMLYDLAVATDGMSGRGLRKLPMKAYAFYISKSVCTLFEFFQAIKRFLHDSHEIPHSNNSL